jgi:hypothetical protein
VALRACVCCCLLHQLRDLLRVLKCYASLLLRVLLVLHILRVQRALRVLLVQRVQLVLHILRV